MRKITFLYLHWTKICIGKGKTWEICPVSDFAIWMAKWKITKNRGKSPFFAYLDHRNALAGLKLEKYARFLIWMAKSMKINFLYLHSRNVRLRRPHARNRTKILLIACHNEYLSKFWFSFTLKNWNIFCTWSSIFWWNFLQINDFPPKFNQIFR